MKIEIKKALPNHPALTTVKTVTGIRGLIRHERTLRQRTGRGVTYVWANLFGLGDKDVSLVINFHDSTTAHVKFASLRVAYDFVKARKSWDLQETKQTATGFVFDIPLK